MDEKAYITVLEWPANSGKPERTALLVNALGMDPYNAAQKAIHDAPLVITRVEAPIAPNVVNALRAGGATAFMMTQSFLKAQPQPRLVRTLSPAIGCSEPIYMAECWQGDPAGLKSADIFLIVRGTVDKSKVTASVEASNRLYSDPLSPFNAGTDDTGPIITRTNDHKQAHIIDIYLTDGRRFRISSERASFEVLADQRAMTPRENADRLALRLATEAPTALVDTNFAKFKVPPDFVREFTQAFGRRVSTQRDDSPVFDFYSIWTHAICKGIARQAAS